MNGAREYAKMFQTGQYGKLFLVSGSHARGRTFHIYVLPSSEKIEGMPWSCKDAVEVFGVIGGNPGWTESYGWLYMGRWQDDFYALVEEQKKKIAEAETNAKERKEKAKMTEMQNKEALLKQY